MKNQPKEIKKRLANDEQEFKYALIQYTWVINYICTYKTNKNVFFRSIWLGRAPKKS